MQRYNNKIALITGAGSGIGRATAKRLASEGASLMLVDRNEEGLQQTVSELPQGTQVMTRAMDVSVESEVEQCVADTLAKYGRIDVLCNNAGIAGGDYSIAPDQSLETWQKIIAVNLYGVMLFTKYVSRQMGHASVAFTMDRYAHLFESTSTKAMQRLNGTIPEPVRPELRVVAGGGA